MKIERKQKLLAKMRALPGAVRQEMKKALRVGAEEMSDTAQAFAPIGETGALRASIGYTFGEYKSDNANVRGVGAGGGVGDPDLSVAIHAGDARAWYARLVEFGTRAHSIKAEEKRLSDGSQFYGTEVRHPGTAGQPFFYPAYRLTKKRMRSRLQRATTSAAKKVAAR